MQEQDRNVISRPMIAHRFSYENHLGEPRAYVDLVRKDGVLWVSALWVHEEYRRKGYAKALLTEVVRFAKDEDVYLSIFPYTDRPLNEEQLRSLYVQFGFFSTIVPGVLARRPCKN